MLPKACEAEPRRSLKPDAGPTAAVKPTQAGGRLGPWPARLVRRRDARVATLHLTRDRTRHTAACYGLVCPPRGPRPPRHPASTPKAEVARRRRWRRQTEVSQNAQRRLDGGPEPALAQGMGGKRGGAGQAATMRRRRCGGRCRPSRDSRQWCLVDGVSAEGQHGAEGEAQPAAPQHTVTHLRACVCARERVSGVWRESGCASFG